MGWLARALTKVSAMCLNMVAKSSALIAGSAFALQAAQELLNEGSWKVKEVPCKINLAALWISCN